MYTVKLQQLLNTQYKHTPHIQNIHTIYVPATVKLWLMSVETIIEYDFPLFGVVFFFDLYKHFQNVSSSSTDFETTEKWQAAAHLVLNHLIVIIRR